MPKLKFTKRAVEAIPHPQSGQILYRDTEQRGLGIRVGSKSKVYFAEGQVNRRNKRVTIGRTDLFAPEVARKKAAFLLAEMAEGKVGHGQISVPTLAQAIHCFVEAKPALASWTKDAYTRSFTFYLRSWSNRLVTDISRTEVMNRHRALSAERGAVTANNVFRHFRSVYNFTAARFETFPPNPVTILTQARLWNPEKRRRTVISSIDLAAWWSALEDDTEDARDIFRLTLLTGMRRSEVLGLRWENLDFSDRSLFIPKTKNGDALHLPLGTYATDMLKSRRDRVGQTEWVFPGKGKTGHIAETKSMTKRISNASGVSFTMHDLRRTFVTIAESLDIPHYALKRLLNHRTDTDVTGGYIVINAERLRYPVEQVTRRVLELAHGQD